MTPYFKSKIHTHLRAGRVFFLHKGVSVCLRIWCSLNPDIASSIEYQGKLAEGGNVVRQEWENGKTEGWEYGLVGK